MGDLSVRQELLAQGLAFVTPDPADPAQGEYLKNMLAIEARAQEHQHGFWGTTASPLTSVENIKYHNGHYRIVTGRVISVTNLRNKTYINYGSDYRTDFTVLITGRVRAKMKQTRAGLKQWENTLVSVRGIIIHQNGPMIIPLSPYDIHQHDPEGKTL